MFFPLRRSTFRKFCALLCLVSLTAILWGGSFLSERFTTVHARDVQTRDEPTRDVQTALQPLVQTGADQYQAGDYTGAIATWQQALTEIDPNNLEHQAIVIENLARAHRQTGQFSQEIDYWEQAIQRYEQQGDFQAIGRSLTEQAQAYSRLGQHRQAIARLCGATADDAISDAIHASADACDPSSALHLARAVADVSGEAAALGSLGEAYRLTGDYNQALSALEQSLSIIETHLSNPLYEATILNSLGNSYGALAQASLRRARAAAARGDTQDEMPLMEKTDAYTRQAIAALERSVAIAEDNQLVPAQVRSQLSLVPLYRRIDQASAATQTWQTTRQLLTQVPPSQDTVFNLLTLAGYLESDTSRYQCPAADVKATETQLLESAVDMARTLESSRAESFALGQLGNLHERCGEMDEALRLTQAARIAADQGRASPDSAYLWAWQQGRILNQQGQADSAATAYQRAIDLLDSVRSDLLNANQDLQFDFRDRVEPIYREFADLTLKNVPASVALDTTQQPGIDTVLVTLDSLKLAELQNYFANDCVITPTATRIDTLAQSVDTAVISTAILSERPAVIASFPDGKRQVEWLSVDQAELTQRVLDYRLSLESGLFDRSRFTPDTTLYDLLIRPLESQLAELNIQTLVFINDGILRSIPMSTLYDGQQYLIEKYAIATTPSLTLTDPNPLDRSNLNALIMGLSEAAQVGTERYPALQNVTKEIDAVKQQFPNSQILANEAFSLVNLRRLLQANSYPILHMATHGSFGAEPQDNFIVTGQKNEDDTNKALTISELDALIRSVSSVERSPIDLLTLTACETSIGDDRATLGLAGVAVRAGVRSAIASLWSVDDQATAELITRFYAQLQDPAVSKAQALRAAQLEVIQNADGALHPYYWAPFILIGNWL